MSNNPFSHLDIRVTGMGEFHRIGDNEEEEVAFLRLSNGQHEFDFPITGEQLQVFVSFLLLQEEKEKDEAPHPSSVEERVSHSSEGGGFGAAFDLGDDSDLEEPIRLRNVTEED